MWNFNNFQGYNPQTPTPVEGRGGVMGLSPQSQIPGYFPGPHTKKELYV